MSAKNPWVGREKAANSRKPGCEKRSVELGMMGDQLGNLVGASVGGEHVEGGMATKKRRKPFPGIRLGNGFPIPDDFRVVSLVEAVPPNLATVEAEFHLNGFEFAKMGVDGDGGHLHDGPPRRGSAGFEVNENKSFVRDGHDGNHSILE